MAAIGKNIPSTSPGIGVVSYGTARQDLATGNGSKRKLSMMLSMKTSRKASNLFLLD